MPSPGAVGSRPAADAADRVELLRLAARLADGRTDLLAALAGASPGGAAAAAEPVLVRLQFLLAEAVARRARAARAAAATAT